MTLGPHTTPPDGPRIRSAVFAALLYVDAGESLASAVELAAESRNLSKVEAEQVRALVVLLVSLEKNGDSEPEFRCPHCGWTDTRPDKCTNCGSRRGPLSTPPGSLFERLRNEEDAAADECTCGAGPVWPSRGHSQSCPFFFARMLRVFLGGRSTSEVVDE